MQDNILFVHHFKIIIIVKINILRPQCGQKFFNLDNSQYFYSLKSTVHV